MKITQRMSVLSKETSRKIYNMLSALVIVIGLGCIANYAGSTVDQMFFDIFTANASSMQ